MLPFWMLKPIICIINIEIKIYFYNIINFQSIAIR